MPGVWATHERGDLPSGVGAAFSKTVEGRPGPFFIGGDRVWMAFSSGRSYQNHVERTIGFGRDLRAINVEAIPKFHFYCERLRKWQAVFSDKNVLDVAHGYAFGHFYPAALPTNLLARSRYKNGRWDGF